MTQRRVQLIGYTSQCEITLNWNEQQVFAGVLAAQGDPDNAVVLAEWQCDRSITGQIPLRIDCHSGSATVVTVLMNYVRPGYVEPLFSDQAEWTAHTPTEPELENDLGTLSESELFIKYNVDAATLQSWLVPQPPISSKDHMCEPFEIGPDNDGKLDVKIDGVACNRHSLDRYGGAWHWSINSGQTLTCDILIDPAVIMVDQ